jgi:hypothetical protein
MIYLKTQNEIFDLECHLQKNNRLHLSLRSVLATQICSALKINFNDQMGKVIDDIWMVLILCILLYFYYYQT